MRELDAGYTIRLLNHIFGYAADLNKYWWAGSLCPNRLRENGNQN
jgi:hypothetical protein